MGAQAVPGQPAQMEPVPVLMARTVVTAVMGVTEVQGEASTI